MSQIAFTNAKVSKGALDLEATTLKLTVEVNINSLSSKHWNALRKLGGQSLDVLLRI